MTLQVNGVTYATDAEGYLANCDDWNVAVAEALAAEDGCELTQQHWAMLNFVRDYYFEHNIAPPMRILAKAAGDLFGREYGNSRFLYELFPYGPPRLVCRYAGLPKPTGCV